MGGREAVTMLALFALGVLLIWGGMAGRIGAEFAAVASPTALSTVAG